MSGAAEPSIAMRVRRLAGRSKRALREARRRFVRSSTAARGRRLRVRAEGALRLTAARVDPRERALPDFVVIGAQKAGTSSFFGQLAAHPSVVPSLRKEVHFFDRSTRPMGLYRAYFPRQAQLDAVAAQTGRALTGEASPYYMFHPAVPARVHAAVPDVRLIAVLRDPVQRAISGYYHVVRRGDERRPIEEALDPAADEALAPPTDAAWYDAPDCPARLRGYLARGRYAEQLERWLAVFPRDQLLVLESSALRGGRVPPEVLAFLELPPDPAPVVPDENVGRYAPPASEVEARLVEYFRPHNERLFSLLGIEFPWPT